jgi:hypothetical protein
VAKVPVQRFIAALTSGIVGSLVEAELSSHDDASTFEQKPVFACTGETLRALTYSIWD